MRATAAAPVGPAQPDGQAFEGRRPERSQAEQPKLPLDPVANFTFLYHPQRWDVAEVEEEFVLVPRLARFHHQAGVLGVSQVRGQVNGDEAAALAFRARKGFVRIDPDKEVTAWGKTVQGYSVQYDGHRGPVHLTAWERPYMLGGTLLVDHDDEGWNAWRRGLVTSKVIPSPDRMVVRALQMTMTRAMQARQSQDRSAGAISRGEILERKLVAFDGGKSATSPTSKE